MKHFLLLFPSKAADELLHVIPHVSFRPLTVSTEEYGKMWLAFAHDTKQNLKLMSDGQESLAATLNVLTEKLQLHVVEIIGEKETSSGAPLVCVGAFPTSQQSHS